MIRTLWKVPFFRTAFSYLSDTHKAFYGLYRRVACYILYMFCFRIISGVITFLGG